MKCETIRSMISSYIDKDLNDIEKTELEKHIAECQQCREEYESMLDIIAVCGNLDELELPQSFRAELHQKLVEEKKKRNIFSGVFGSTGRKMATGLVAAALVLAIGIGSSSLLQNKNLQLSQNAGAVPEYGTEMAPAAPPSDTMGEGAQNGIAAKQAPEAPILKSEVTRNSTEMKFSESLAAADAAPAENEIPSRSGRMVIRTGNLSINVENVDKAADAVKQLAEGSGGFIEYSQIDNITVPKYEYNEGAEVAVETTEKQANMTIRVPEGQFQSIFNNIKGMGKLVNENINGNDITSEYRDTQARVDNLKIQEESLKQLMTKAKNVDEILRIETELNRVRTDIDINTGSLKRWDNLVQLSTINIYMKELKPEELKSVDVPGMWGKAYQGFIKAINNVVGGLEKAVIFLVAAIPYMIVAAIAAAIVVFIAGKLKLKKKQ